jgi:hypothetical protein
MSITNFKKPGSNCSDNHAKVSKHVHSRQDVAFAEYLISDLTSKWKQHLTDISKNILRLAVNLLEYGRRYSNNIVGSIVLQPRTQRSKPLCKFTKGQLVRRIVQISTDFNSQINTITAQKERQEAERQEAERQEAERQEEERQEEATQNDCCPICLDPLENQAQCTSPCGHTFCSPCFVKNISMELSRGHTARCAYCRTTTVEIDVRNAW